MHEFFAFLPLGKPRATNPVRAHLAIPVQTHPAIPVTPPTDRKFQRRFKLPMCTTTFGTHHDFRHTPRLSAHTTAFGTCKEFLHVPKRVKNVAILLHVKNPVSRIFPCGNPIFLTTSSLSRPLTRTGDSLDSSGSGERAGSARRIGSGGQTDSQPRDPLSLLERPYCQIADVENACNVTRPTATKRLKELVAAGVLDDKRKEPAETDFLSMCR